MASESLIAESKALATKCRRALSSSLGDAPRARGHDLADLDDNLVGCDAQHIRVEFGSAQGGELKRKMRVPWSSSALCVNSFCRWRVEGSVKHLRVASASEFEALQFERTYSHGIKGPPPHLDVELRRNDGAGAVAIESKLLEPVDLSLKRPSVISAQYENLLTRGDPRSASAWFGALEQIASFDFLGAYQLLKHYLGFVRSGPPGTKTLVYLYWQPLDASHEVFALHREEIERFSNIVNGDPTCEFRSLTYDAHWSELESLDDTPAWLPSHLQQLRSRYAVEVG